MPKLQSSLNENLNYLDTVFANACDFIKLSLNIGGVKCAVLSLEGQVDKQYLAISVIKPMLNANLESIKSQNLMDYISENILAAVDQSEAMNSEDIISQIMVGNAVILVDGSDKAIGFGVQGYKSRGVIEPNNESMLRGSKEGFVEPLIINMSLLRRRLRTPMLKFERLYLGTESKTPIIISYLENRVSKEILSRIKLEIKEIDLKTVMAAGYLSAYLNKGKLFSGVGITERPDTAAAKIEEGRVAIIVDGTPSVLILPYLFVENFQVLDDYANKPIYSSYIRIIKYLCFFISVFVPSLYVGIIVSRPDLIPDNILVRLAMEEAKTPLSIFWELIFVNFLYEIIREAGLRAPKVFSQTVSIVGALVIGDMAVSAGLIGAPSLIIIALSAIAGYAVPKLYEQISVLRFILILVAGLLGVWGTVFSFVFILYNICSQLSYGVPLTTPITPFGLRSMRDIFIRSNWKTLNHNRSKVQDMPGSETRNGGTDN